MTSGIYGIFNTINGKVSVGSTSDFRKRWDCHKCIARKGKHGNAHFQSAWNKYGESAFEFRIIEECSVDALIPREDYWMAFYKSLDSNFGYNFKNASATIISEETRKKMSISRKKYVQSPETHLKRAEAVKKFYRDHPEKRKFMRERQIGSKNHAFGKPCIWATRPFSDQHKANMSKAKSGNKHHMWGKHHSNETRKKMSIANTIKLQSEGSV